MLQQPPVKKLQSEMPVLPIQLVHHVYGSQKHVIHIHHVKVKIGHLMILAKQFHLNVLLMDLAVLQSQAVLKQIPMEDAKQDMMETVFRPVSYTHLTLPTKRIV